MRDNLRHENKYLCSFSDYRILLNRIGSVMKKDPHCVDENGYNIRSIYFDTEYNDFLKENIDGEDGGNKPREKIRIRTYNGDKNRIQLEFKKKIYGLTQKQSVLLSEEQFTSVMNERNGYEYDPDNRLLNRFRILQTLYHVKPAVIVDYNRLPFIYEDGNVRVTFDHNIRSSYDFSSFFAEDIDGRPILPKDFLLMEVKYDEFLPDFIRTFLQLDDMKRIAFSKYYLCRKFNQNGEFLS